MTGVNNLYTETMTSVIRPQEIIESGVLPKETNEMIDEKRRELIKRVGRLPSVELENHRRFVYL